MKKDALILVVLVILAALCLPFIMKVIGTIVGIGFGLIVGVGALLFVVCILALVFSGVGLLVGGVLGLVGVILLALAFPILAPLFIVLLPIIIIIKLIT